MDPELSFDPAEVFDEVSGYLDSLELTGGWQITYFKAGDIIKQRKDVDDTLIYSAETIINKTPEEISSAIIELDQRKKWDNYTLECESLAQWGKNLQLLYLQQKFKWPMSNRDYVLIQGIAREMEDKILIGWKSVGYDKKPHIGSFVRGTIYYSGFIITKVNEVSHVTYVEKSDFSGLIPASLMKMLQKRSLNAVLALKEYLKSN
ncbi:hypothetical protein SteCoe_14654 [Stentor coeruleus]|uniref:START domain-containing protein n=1 Tax=Stentor coeruleus TaxID=5963 RepID=A0A1R2C5H0_9CILI|nr:hypothetical protein SteCoe_14654 [Stentor coeruleus]